MSPLNISFADLVARLDAELPGADPLARVTEAQLRAHTLTDLGEKLVGYYVAEAKRAGASWSQIGDAIGVSKQAAQQRWVPSIFERFTDRARHVVVLAQEAARVRLHHHIGTEHLLLGLLGEPDGLGAQILLAAAGSATVVTDAVDAVAAPGTENSPAKIPFTPDGKAVLEQAAQQSKDLGHDFVGTEHLLLGLLAVTDGTAAGILAGLGVDPEATRTTVIERVQHLLDEDEARG
jgi:hypothetical protein